MRPINTIVYLHFGEGPHTDELVHGVLSVQHTTARERDQYRIVVYTDHPQAFADLGIHVETLSPATLDEWAGPCHFVYRRKIFAIRDALTKFGGRVIYCDADTYFLKHPGKLFDRIRPGRTVMHLEERSPKQYGLYQLSAILSDHDFRMRDGQRWNISPDTCISNAGVIGLHEADLPLLDEVLHLVDQMCPRIDYFGTEQFAFSACFALHTRLTHASDIVHHYWHPAHRELFHTHLSKVLYAPSLGSYEERYRRLMGVRERVLERPETLKRRVHAVLWMAAKKLGILGPIKRALRGARSHVTTRLCMLEVIAESLHGFLASV